MVFRFRSEFLDRLRRDLWFPVVAFVGIFLVFFWKVILRGDLPLLPDPLFYSYPLRTVAWEMIRNGILPLWTPYIFSGYPLLSMAQLGIGYPLTWGYLFLPGHWAETAYVLSPFVLAPIFLFVYLREVGRSRLASFVAALGFAYGGMMSSQLSNGMLPNAVMWFPLLLVAIERSRWHRFIPCLAAATGFYTLSVLTGIGQGLVLIGTLAGVYACAVSAADFFAARGTPFRRRVHAFKPVALIALTAILSMGVAAFQVFETLVSVHLSIREELTWSIFSQLSMPFPLWWRALLVPLYFQIESVPYLAPLILLLALAGVFTSFRRRSVNYRVLFWVAVALMAMFLMLGATIPTYKLIYYIPVLNRFRGPSRHSFEWTLAVSVLSAYGWDALASLHGRLKAAKRERLLIASAGVLVISALAITASWLHLTIPRFPMASIEALNRAVIVYGSWKAAFVVVTVAAFYCAWRLETSTRRAAMLGAIVALSCLTEAYVFMTYSWASVTVPADWFGKVVPSTRYLLDNLGPHDRVYVRVPAFFPEVLEKKVDVLNLTARYHIQNVAGYEPLITRQYSRALNDVWLDGVRRIADDPLYHLERVPELDLLNPKSKVLDLLGTSLVVGFANFRSRRLLEKEKGKIPFDIADFDEADSWTLRAITRNSDSLAIVSSLSNSGSVDTGEAVAKVKVFTQDGRAIERELLAGRDTAEWAFDRPDVWPVIRHTLPTIFASMPGDAEGTFLAHRYLSVVSFGERLAVDRVEISQVRPGVHLRVFKATLLDSSRPGGAPMLAYKESDDFFRGLGWLQAKERWELAYDEDGILILKNKRAFPRAWLVGGLEVVDREEALARIRGESPRDFDPGRTALVENPSFDPAVLPGDHSPRLGEASVRQYGPNRITVETRSNEPALLVLGEVSHPGWKATVDGRPVPVETANYFLRAVLVPSGTHQVELNYTAPAARLGALVSAGTLLLIAGLVVAGRRWHRGEA